MVDVLTILQGLNGINPAWPIAVNQLNQLIGQASQFVSIRHVAGGTSSTLFAAEWGTEPVPEHAVMIEGSQVWYTDDGGASWSKATVDVVSSLAGVVVPFFGDSLPSGTLWANGVPQSRTTYATLYNALATEAKRALTTLTTRTSNSEGTFTFRGAMSNIAVSDSINVYWTGGSRLSMSVDSVTSTTVVLTGGSGDNLPSALSECRLEYAADKFFTVDGRGVGLRGAETIGGINADVLSSYTLTAINEYIGDDQVTLSEANLAPHTHSTFGADAVVNNTGGAVSGIEKFATTGFKTADTYTTGSAGSGTPFDIIPPDLSCNFILITG